jgi:chemotaxis protein MotB
MRSRSYRTEKTDLNIWPGFTDIIVGLLLVFVFVVSLFTVSQTILSQYLSRQNTELERLGKELALKSSEAEKLLAELSKLESLFSLESNRRTQLEESLKNRTADLESATADLSSKSADLEKKDRELESLTASMLKLQSDISEGEKSLADSKSRLDSALQQLQDETGKVYERDERLIQLGSKIRDLESESAKLQKEYAGKDQAIQDLSSKISVLNSSIAALNKQIAQYVTDIDRLNSLLAESRTSESQEKTKTAALQKEIGSLRSRLDELSTKLAKTEVDSEQQFRLSQLVTLLGEKEQEIDRLRKLAKYRSEFLAKLETVFGGLGDIKVQGDRFVFQSEILFGSGKTEINESGKAELDKLVRIYKEMIPRIPKDVPLIIMVQGHTDIDPVNTAKYKSNWELSAARSMEVVRYLIDKGIPPQRIGAAALGEFHPIESSSSPEAKRLNRRIEIKITSL